MAATVTNLAWGMLEFKKGYTSSGQYEYGLKAIKWGTDYFIKCHPSANRFFGQVGDKDLDNGFWGRPEEMNVARPVYEINEQLPGSDLAAETAAALAVGSILFLNNGNTIYADECLQHAEELYSFAKEFKGEYHKSITDATVYISSGFEDELAWAALWLYKTTGDPVYKDDYQKFVENAPNKPTVFSWDDKWSAVKILALQLNLNPDKSFFEDFKSYLSNAEYTPKGLLYVDKYGSLRYASNLAFLSLITAKIEGADIQFFNQFATSQINYILGDTGRSFVVGFGENPPQQPFHKSSSCPSTGSCSLDQLFTNQPNPQILYGALVGGPSKTDRFSDRRANYETNEVNLEFNAGFQSAVSGMVELSDKEQCK
ncbi:endoglucanase F-like [Clytia hemisphaerica]|uniref:endoglucanase F-like n=1 Tax=Clytia hemisphaerica TaxID=252671 RepID=UPI0034D5BD51